MSPQLPLDDDTPAPLQKRGLLARIRSNFLTGLVFIAPIVLTAYFAWWAVNFIDARVEPFIPDRFNPNTIWGLRVPGVGVIFFLIFTTFIGSLTKGFLGRQTIKVVASFMNQFPIVRPIYNAIKQIIETIFASQEQSFQNACMIEYPREGVYAVGFISTESRSELVDKAGEELLAIFIPTTPNPTSGFLLYYPRKDVQILDMSVEEAAKMIISAGLVEPERKP